MKSRLPPHKAARRIACPGSRFLEEKYPDNGDSSFAKEGIAAHWVAGTALALHHVPPKAGFKAPNGEPVTQEMIDGASLYLSAVQMVTKRDNCQPLNVEQHLDISWIHLDCWGIPDAWVICDDELFIWEYKFSHSYVEVYENWQLIEYAAGILELQTYKKVTFCVVQPRNFHPDGPVRYWSIERPELEVLFAALRKAERIASNDDAPCFPSPQCMKCTARRACSTVQSAALTAIDISKQGESFELSTPQIGSELKTLKRYAMLLESRITGLEEHTKHLIKKGERVPGFKMQSVSSREVWTKPAEEIISLGSLLGVDLSKEPATVTPSQARKLGIDDAIIDAYTERQNGALKLVEENAIEAKKVFGGSK